MIVAALGPDLPAYRMHTPRWSYQPLSGAGAAMAGGRLNRPGIDALYLALEPETAIEEFRQDDPLVRPGTLVAYRATIARAADFRAGYDPEHWPPLWQELSCNWKRQAFLDEIEPPSWVIADDVRAAGLAAVVFPSTRRIGGLNLVIYPDLLGADDHLLVHDPRMDLPIDPSSWR
ncbi:RES protein [Lysobacter sp. Root559]|nr:RES protein [Lysobacter sp. Root559]KRA79823.1 RES protein [Lysobacter sp. Root667]KRC34585.1 RES protein [Lysobacter sp. Root76]KRD65891.1 RES protein [Lysobacter sp. Root96]